MTVKKDGEMNIPRDAMLDPMSVREIRQKKQTGTVMLMLAGCMAAAAAVSTAHGSWAEMNDIQIIGAIMSAVLFVLSFSSLAVREWTIGMLPPGITAVWGFVLSLRWAELAASPKLLPGIVLTVVMVVLTAVVLVFAVLAAAIFIASLKTADLRHDADRLTLVVLGFRLAEGKPNAILKNRLKKAAEVLQKYPDMNCILAGGRINDDEPAESEVMRDYLTEMGIAAERLTVENRSTTTYENLRNCRDIARENGFPARFALVTDRFHQLRVRLICRDNGIECAGVNSELPLCLLLQYWGREVLCLLEKWIKRL